MNDDDHNHPCLDSLVNYYSLLFVFSVIMFCVTDTMKICSQHVIDIWAYILMAHFATMFILHFVRYLVHERDDTPSFCK